MISELMVKIPDENQKKFAGELIKASVPMVCHANTCINAMYQVVENLGMVLIFVVKGTSQVKGHPQGALWFKKPVERKK